MKGELLKALRIEAKLTQSELANKIGVSGSTIRMIELGKRSGSREVENKIADFFNVSLDYLEGKVEGRTQGVTAVKKQLVSELLAHFVETGIIQDENNIDPATQEFLFNMIKKEIADLKANKK